MTIEAPKRIRENCIDLHTHGLGDARDFSSIDRANQVGLKALAIGFRGGGIMPNYADLSDYISEKGYGLKLITMTECNFTLQPNVVADFIALDFDPNHESVISWKGILEDHNRNAAIVQINKLSQIGFVFKGLEQDNSERLKNVLTGKASERSWQLAKILVTSEVNRDVLKNLEESYGLEWQLAKDFYTAQYKDKEYVDAKLVYRFLFAKGKPYFEPAKPYTLSLPDFANTFRDAGGKVFYSPEGKYHTSEWPIFKEYVDGVMLWHGSKLDIPQGYSKRDLVESLTREGKLIIGGSDYDPEKNHWQVGVGDGQMRISEKRIKTLNSTILQHV